MVDTVIPTERDRYYMERTVVSLSSASEPEQAFLEVSNKIKENTLCPDLIVFFSDTENFNHFTNRFHEEFPTTTVIGSSTYINFCSEGIAHKALSAMAVCDGIECSSGVLFEISTYPLHYIENINSALEELSSTENTCCLEFCTAFSNGEELVLDTFQDAFEGKNIPVIGGSSGTVPSEEMTTVVSLNGVCYVNSCVFVLIHNLDGRIIFQQENIFKPTGKTFSVTDLDVEKRTVYEYDDKPAADVIASALNISLEKLPEAVTYHPMGRIIGDDIFIMEADKVMPDGSISYFAQVYNHTKMALLEVDDFQKVREETHEEVLKKMKKHSFSIVINCRSRSVLFERRDRMNEFNNALTKYYGPFIGLSGYGEQINHMHLNQTMIILLFE